MIQGLINRRPSNKLRGIPADNLCARPVHLADPIRINSRATSQSARWL